MTRRLCSGPCASYFTPRSSTESWCDDCAAKLIDHEAGMICQDNKEPGDWLRPVDALSLAKVRVANAQLVHELNTWKRFGRASYSALCALATPRMFPKDRETLAKRHLEIFEKDFPEVVEDINGPVYGQRQG